MRFGIELPTCTSGMMHPVPFATVHQVVDLAIEAEQLGYHEAAGNDHLSTMDYIRKAWNEPPDFFEPLVVLAHVAAKTSVLRLATGIMVMTLRDPVLLAKQVATLDRLSDGRVTLGVAVGGYRDEFESVVPELRYADRAELVRERIAALRVLWERRHSSYQGKYVRFESVESYPKPVQSPLPILSGGNADGSLRRAAELCDGWLPAKLGPDGIRAGRAKVAEYAEVAGRDPATLVTALQSVVCLGDTTEQARQRYRDSSFDLFRQSLSRTMTRGVDQEEYFERNLVGTPDEVCAKVAAYERAGLDQFSALLFVGNTVEEMREQIRLFARHVMPAFTS